MSGMTDELDEHWFSEQDVEGTCMDVSYYARWIKAKYSGLWHWHCDEQVLMYRSWPQAIIEQAKEEAFLAWGL
jgi:hypothetical protein